MTDRQLEVLQAVADLIDEHGWPPSLTEIGARIGVTSKSTTHRLLACLEWERLIVRGPHARQLRITEDGRYQVMLHRL